MSVICSLQNWDLVCREATSDVKSRVLSHSSSVLLRTRDALESKRRQQLDRCLAATVWAARHHSNMHHSLLPLDPWKPHQCTSAWRHQLKPTRMNMFIRNQWGTSMSWSSIWLKRGQQPAELHWSSNWSVARLLNAYLKAKSKHWTFAIMFFVTVMTFKAYVTADMNKLTYVSFHKVGWVHPSG